MIDILSMKKENTITSIRYGSETQNAYNNIATLLNHALPLPHPEPEPTPVP